MKKGIFCLSFDVENNWGRVHLKNADSFLELSKKEKPAIKKILKLLDKYQIKATFAVVGKLFEEDPDLIKILKKSGHEIASHSYTHADFSKISKEKAEEELKACISLAKKRHIEISSFVFPFNKVGHLNILKKYGIKIYRKPSSKLFPNINSLILPNPSLPLKTLTLPSTKGSLYFASNRNLGKYIPQGLRALQAKKGIELAIKKGEIFHLWTHPVDLENQELFKEFENIIAYTSQLISSKKMQAFTMAEIADKLDL